MENRGGGGGSPPMEWRRGRDMGLEASVGGDAERPASGPGDAGSRPRGLASVSKGLLTRKHFSLWALSMLEKRKRWPHTSQGYGFSPVCVRR